MNAAAPQERVVIFLHLPKCGGQTLSAALRRAHRGAVMLHPESLSMPLAQRMATYDPAELAEARLVWGHVHYGIHEHLARPAVYTTLLRDPVDRVVSLYRYIRRQPQHPLHDQVTSQGLSLSDYVVSDIDRQQVDNGQTRLLSGRRDGAVDEGMLAEATRNLASFAAIGLVERFDTSFALIARRLDLPMRFYLSRNRGRAGRTAADLPEATRAVIEQRNRHDRHLYRAAEELHDQQVAAEGAALQRDLRRLRLVNAVVGRGARTYWWAKSRRG